LQQGLEKGHIEALKATARSALAEGLTPEFVQKITGLDAEVIRGLAKEQ
jgi:hypothetical protein